MTRLATCLVLIALLSGCTPQQRSPDQIRDQTAKATHEAAQDARAAVQGVVQGLKEKGPVNINKASADDLKTLPGIGDDTARKIIAGRPYDDGNDLVKKHLVSRAEYDRIADKITTR